MGFSTTEERNKVRLKLEKEKINLVVEKVLNKDPLLVLREVLFINTNEDDINAPKESELRTHQRPQSRGQ